MPYKKYLSKSHAKRYPRKLSRMSIRKLNTKVNKLIKKTELKQMNTNIIGQVILDGVGNQIQLTNIVQGITDQTRLGNQITVESIFIRCIFHIATAAHSSQVRMLVVHDRQCNGAVYATSEILDSVLDLRSLITPYNLDNRKRFHILKDHMIMLNRPGPTSTLGYSRYWKFWKKLNINLRYDQNLGSILDLTEGSLSLLFIGNELIADAPTVDLDVRIMYSDS